MISIAGCNKSEPMTEADLNRRTPEQQEAYEKRFDMSGEVDYTRDKGIPLTPIPKMKSGQE